ncbi:MAG: M14 family zinc carboxypeptidase, partial [Acidobacteriota bacterium]
QGGGYDPNRDWGSYWQPPYIQRGAGAYPFYWKESKLTRDFLYDHPNIAGVQAFHNSGVMILRVPGAQLHGEVPRSDKAVYDEIGEKGEKIIEGYDYYVIWKDLYTVWGGFIDFTYDMLRIHSFSNEIWTSRADLDGDREITEEEEEFFDRYIDMGNKEIAMHEIDHPQLGKVIIDLDRTKLSGRVPPSWLLEELCHRNMAFCLLHAYEMPLPKIKKVSAEKVSSDLYKVKVSISNGRLMPTLSAQAIESQVQRPDVLSVQGDVDVLAAGQSQGTGLPAGIPRRYLRYFRGMGAADSDVNLIEQKDPTRLKLFNGIPGRTEVEYQFLIKGKGKVTVELDCLKGGTHTKDLELK